TRHYSLMAALARSHGAVVRVPIVQRLPVRSLVAVAAENAREGCVRETFGALTAAYQVSHAQDPLLRAAMNTIARDEARHARLSWAVDAWARTVVPRAAIAVLDEAKAAAATEMAAELAAAPPPDRLAAAVGLPSAAVAGDLMERGRRSLWAA
ncbi:MAG TPA: ferritin-like domain-containing protein, partial [Polyangia bacterium]|nr:ferritin-like domain-containing protein [Polyangia bacterium]